MTMNPNTELNTMMFFDDALESERTYLLTELADAVSETRTAADQAAQLSEDGEAGLLRLTEIWCGQSVFMIKISMIQNNGCQGLCVKSTNASLY